MGNKAITTIDTIIPLEALEEGNLVSLRIMGANYDYRYVLVVEHQGYGGNGNFSIIATLLQHNGAALGSPTFSVNTLGELIITNANYVSKGIIAYYTVTQIGQRKEKHL
jgi:hypothetical protein